MGENVRFRSFSFDNMLPLDMLAEVASETLKNDPSLSLKYDPSDKKSPAFANNKVCCQKRSATSSERLTLDQIRTLSDKMLLEMFSEHSSDEIRKNFSYKCYLIPEKCHEVFSSFGSETKARLQMKSHLVSHVAELISDANSPESKGNSPFEAEPLHVKKKKQLETGPKKRKKVKNLTKKVKTVSPKHISEKKITNPKPKAIKSVENKVKKEVKLSNNLKGRTLSTASMLNGMFRARLSKCSQNIPKVDKVEKENERYRALMEESFLPLPKPTPENSSSFAGKVSSERNGLNNCSTFSRKLKSEALDADVESMKQSSSECKVEPVDNIPIITSDNKSQSSKLGVKVDVGNNFWPNTMESIFSRCIKREPVIYPLHDHTYTSINGKTFNEASGENGKSVNKTSKEGRKVLNKNSGVPLQMIISTPPFPYIYIPILPHIAEIREVGNHKNRSCDKSSRNNRSVTTADKESNSSVQNSKDANETVNKQNTSSSIIPRDLGPETEDDENMPFSFTATHCVEGRLQNCETNNDSIIRSAGETELKTDVFVNSSPGTERKLALKCIRQLRTKKKEERGPLVCQICKDKSFTAQATLMYHYRSHAGIKPFSCSVCDATFTRQHSLNYHMLIHNNKSRFVCSDCGRNFRHPSHYKEHLRRHTGETPYQCTDCNLRFKTRNTYKRHLKTRHGKILTARGIRVLSIEEFDKVRTSPRKRTPKHVLISHKNDEMEWQNVTFTEYSAYRRFRQDSEAEFEACIDIS